MTLLVLGLALFIAVHAVPMRPTLRGTLTGALGEGGYKIAFSLASLVALVLIVYGKGDAPFVAVWTPPVWTRHVTAVLMIVAFVVLIAAFVPSNLRVKLKHPMLLAVKIWALAHLLANGDLASMLLFGGLLAFAVADRISVKKRGLMPAASSFPLWRDALVVGLGIGAYLLVAMNHARLFGVAAIG